MPSAIARRGGLPDASTRSMCGSCRSGAHKAAARRRPESPSRSRRDASAISWPRALGHGAHVTGRRQHAAGLVHNLERPAGGAGHDRQARIHRLDQRQAEWLGLQVGLTVDVGGRNHRARVVAGAQQLDARARDPPRRSAAAARPRRQSRRRAARLPPANSSNWRPASCGRRPQSARGAPSRPRRAPTWRSPDDRRPRPTGAGARVARRVRTDPAPTPDNRPRGPARAAASGRSVPG